VYSFACGAIRAYVSDMCASFSFDAMLCDPPLRIMLVIYVPVAFPLSASGQTCIHGWLAYAYVSCLALYELFLVLSAL
jgi:hypothetical protein